MKTAIYIEDGVVQLVLTPTIKFEKDAINSLREKSLDVKIFNGSFYDCRGGWVRQNAITEPMYFDGTNRDDQSLILTIREEKEENKE